MKFNRFREKGTRLSRVITFTVVVPVVITIIITSLTSYYGERSTLTDMITDMNRVDADEKATALASLLDAMDTSLAKTAGYLADSPGLREHASFFLDYLHGSVNYFSCIHVSDRSGTVAAIIPANKELLGKQLTNVATVQSIVRQQPYVSAPYWSEMHQYSITVSHPIIDENGVYQGFVAGIVDLNHSNVFQNLLSLTANFSGTTSYIVDSSGGLLYHPDPSFSLEKLRGDEMMSTSSPVPQLGWAIVTQTPQLYLRNHMRKLVHDIIKMLIPYMFILSLFIVWITRKIVSPIENITEYAINFFQQESQSTQPSAHYWWNYEANELTRVIVRVFSKAKKQHEVLFMEARTDVLTGLANRKIIDFQDQVTSTYAVAIIDIDFFKAINDTCGHLIGDEVLKQLAAVLMEETRDSDVCCRYGGEEFLVLFPHTTRYRAYKIAESIRLQAERRIVAGGSQITVSVGVAAIHEGSISLYTLIDQADKALYQAKKLGKNRVMAYADSDFGDAIEQNA